MFCILNLGIELFEVRQDEPFVDEGGALDLGEVEEDEEDELEEVVEGDVVEDDGGEMVDYGEEAEDDPVSEPLLLVSGAFGLEGEEAHDLGVDNTEHAGDVDLVEAEHT